ncbi:MAG TPA: serine hydrolase domain-containing protein [Geminicoccus sp.]|jgi:D-alanyl-D-alanine carboxypeptidase|uniref:serine hydrolase domain-containing protein n=1 Tax=Geminicoccus sp. TaxID=2024832 RepID=UPI002E2ED80B|nr:serine hydrolase domain-containing protein [Geminicoccus sp.]HEX2525413.1 serine hydrolase domain-containing protein [Geminicoccus sp.]
MISRRGFAAGLAGAVLSGHALAEGAASHKAHRHVDEAMAPIIKDWQAQSPKTPGVAVGIRFSNGHVWNRGFGLADLRGRRPMPANGFMRVGSVTKTFTGTVLLQLVDAGLIGLDDTLSQHIRGAIPPIPDADRITIRMLGNMSSGLFDYVDIVEPGSDPSARIWTRPFTMATPRELVTIGLSRPPNFPPGQGWNYSNTNFVLLGMIIRNLTGRSLSSNIRQRILKPLGLSDTYFPLNTKYQYPHPEGYSLKGPDYTSLAQITSIHAGSGAWACGNMISTPQDMLRYAKPLATGRLISKTVQKERTKWLDGTPYAPGKPFTDQKYGFALAKLDGLIGHGGNIQGYDTFLGHLPAVDASIVVISNLYLTNDPGLGSPGLAKQLAARLLSEAI